MGLTHPPRQLGGGIRPHAVGPEPVIPSAYRLMRTEVGRERSPGAACMLQVETAVHHLAHIGGESKVAGEQRFDEAVPKISSGGERARGRRVVMRRPLAGGGRRIRG